MAQIFGFEIRRATPPLLTRGTSFEARSIQNMVKAASAKTIQDGGNELGTSAARKTSLEIYTGDEDLGMRQVRNDPRELYWGVLPNKIQPKQALQMLRAALAGDLWQQWRLNAAMLDTWPKYAMAQHQLREAVSYVKFTAHPFLEREGETPSESAIDKRNLVMRALASMSPDPFNDEKNASGMIYNFTDAVCSGIALEEVIWKNPERIKGGKWQRLPKATAWTHPRHFTFNQDGSVVIFKSQSSLNVGDVRRYGKTGSIGELPNPNKIICSQFMSRSGASSANGFMRQLVWWWCARQYGLDFVLRNAQNFGHPFVDVTYSPGMSNAEKMQLVADIIKGLGNRVLLHPEGSTLSIESAQNLGTDNPQRWIIEESDREVLYLLLGQTSSTISTPGKLGNEESHDTVKQERVSGVAKWVAQNPLQQFARLILRVNYGDDTECPTFEPDFTKPLNAAQVGTLATAITNSRLPVKANEHYTKLGYTPPKPGEHVIIGGEHIVFEDPITSTEKAKRQMEMQRDAMKTEAEDDREKSKARGMDVKSILSGLPEKELSEVESLVIAAEKAPHRNGELTALMTKLKSHRRK